MVIMAASAVEPSVQCRIDFVFVLMSSSASFLFQKRNKETSNSSLSQRKDFNKFKAIRRRYQEKFADASRAEAGRIGRGLLLLAEFVVLSGDFWHGI